MSEVDMDRPLPPRQNRFVKAAAIKPPEVRAVFLSMAFFFLLFTSYSLIKPVRDTMGTVYGMSHIQELFTVTFLASLIFAPLYSNLVSRTKLATFLPWVYGFVGLTLLAFYALFAISHGEDDRYIAGAFYIWINSFNILIISVFWTFMADIFSREQAKRLFGVVAAGGSFGGIVGSALAAYLVHRVDYTTLMLFSAVGFFWTAVLVTRLVNEKRRMTAAGVESQRTTLDRELVGSSFDGFKLLAKSRYMMLLVLFLSLMTCLSTIVYIQLGDLMTNEFLSREARIEAYSYIDLIVYIATAAIQFFRTGRIVARFGVTGGLLVNPILMVVALVAMAFSPVLMVVVGIQMLRRVAEYALAKPTREMLFTVVDQQSRYKAKNVIDTVVFPFGDFSSAWLSSILSPFGVGGLAIFGLAVCVAWFRVAHALGKYYERTKEVRRIPSIRVVPRAR